MARLPRNMGENPLGRLIYMARRERRMSQAELAAAVGYSRSWIAILENSVKRPNISADLAHRLNTVLEIPLEAILSAEEIAEPLMVWPLDREAQMRELRELTEVVLRLRSTPADIRVAKDMLRLLHRHRQEESTKGGDPPVEPAAP